MTSIFKAVYENNVESIKQFIRDADRTAPLPHKESQSSSQGNRKKVIGSMTNINKRSILGKTALHLAAQWNRVEIVQLLVDCPQVNVNVRDRESGWTALHRALYAGHIESALIILARDDTDLSVKDFEGNTALDLYNSTIDDTKPSARIINANVHNGIDSDLFSFAKSTAVEEEEATGITGGTEVFTWGYNTNYVLGQRDSENRSRPDRVQLNLVSQQIPQVLRRPEYVISSVTMSKFHSAIVTSELEQNLLICGFGGARLGLGHEDTQFLFKPVCGIPGQVVTVALGRDHTIVVTSNGDVYSFGNNVHGQLGYETEKSHGQRVPQFIPRKIIAPSIKKERIIGAAASSVHSAVYTETDLYTFGLNQGQLGYYPANGEFDQVFPRKVSFLPPGACIIQAACIDTATIVLTASHHVFVLFSNGHQKVAFPKQRFPADFVRYVSAPNYIVKVMAGGDDFFGAISNMGDFFIWTIPSRKGSVGGPKSKLSLLTSVAEPQRSRSSILPRRIWALRKSHLTLCDASIGQDGSVIVCTASGHIFLGTPRKIPKKNKNLVEKKLYKFIKVPRMQRCIMVAASPTGAYAALRAEKRLSEVQIPKSTLATDMAISLPHLQNARNLQLAMETERMREQVLFAERSKVPFFEETEAFDTLPLTERSDASSALDWSKLCEMKEQDPAIDAYISVGDMKFYCHQIILACRSQALQKAFFNLSRTTADAFELLHNRSERTVRFIKQAHGQQGRAVVEIILPKIHMEAVWFFLDFMYSDAYEHPMNAFYGSSRQYNGDLHVRTKLQSRIKPQLLQKELIYLSEVFQLPTLQDSVSSSFNSQPRPALASQMELAYSDEKSLGFLSDVQLRLEDGEILCHELVLRQRSPFFATLFDPSRIWTSERRNTGQRFISVDLKHVTKKTMDIVLRFLYGDNRTTLFHDLDESPESLFTLISNVLEIADELMIDDLKIVCQSALLRLVTSKNVLSALVIADDYRAEHVKAACLEFLGHNLDFYLETGALVDIKPSLIADIQSEVQKLQSSKAFCPRPESQADWNDDGHENDPELNAKVHMDFSEESIWAESEETYYTIRPTKQLPSTEASLFSSSADDDLIFQQDEDILEDQQLRPEANHSRTAPLSDVLYDTPDNENDDLQFPALGTSLEDRGIANSANIPVPKRGWTSQFQDNSAKQNIRELLERQDGSPSLGSKVQSSPTRPIIIPKKMSQKERRKLQQQEAAMMAEAVNTPKSVWGKPVQLGQPVAITPSPPVATQLSTPPTLANRKVSIAEIMDEEKAQKAKGRQPVNLSAINFQPKKIYESREAAEQSIKCAEPSDLNPSRSNTLSSYPIRKASTAYKPTLISRRQAVNDCDVSQASTATPVSINSFAAIQNQQLKESVLRGKKFKKSLIRIQQEEQAIAALMEFYTQTVEAGTGEWFRIARAEAQ